MSFIFNENYSYKFINIIKQFDGKFDPETKKWSIPLKHKFNFNSMIEKEKQKDKERGQLNWEKACQSVGVKFCKKGSDEYYEVLTVFKELMKC